MEVLRNFIINESYLNDEKLNNFINYLDAEINSEEIDVIISDCIDELNNDLIYAEVEDSYNGGETDLYNNLLSKIEFLESYVYMKINE